MNNSSIYLIESSKGLVSLYSLEGHPRPNSIFVFLGPVARMSESLVVGLMSEKLVFNSVDEVELFSSVFLSRSSILPMFDVYYTDQTYNIMSFVFTKCFDKCIRKRILLDHLEVDKLTFRSSWLFLNRSFFKMFLYEMCAFRPIKFNNGARGYSMKVNYNEIVKIQTWSIMTNRMNYEGIKFVFLFPIFAESKIVFSQVLKYFLNFFNSLPLEERSLVLLKFHPREKLDDSFLVKLFKLSPDQVISKWIPFEFLEFSGAVIFMFESGAKVSHGNRVVNLASGNYFKG